MISIGGAVKATARMHARRTCARVGLTLALVPILLHAAAASASAALVMEGFPGGPLTGQTAPTFDGSTEDTVDPVSVSIFKGKAAIRTPLQSVSASPAPTGSWSATAAPLQQGTYTAVAEQTEVGGSGQTAKTPPYTFTVNTQPPTVTLNKPASPSNNTTPSFSGTASDTTLVSVDVYKGSSAEGQPVAVLGVQGTGGSWTSADVRPPLEDGIYTAIATQPSSLGNPAGVSNAVSFEVRTAAPKVTLQAPPSPSSDTTPSFSGTASEATPVTVEVFAGARAEGDIVATATAPGGGSWTSARLAPALPSGRHTFTAIATQPSALKNGPGRSSPVTFVVNTEPPSVTLQAPPSPSSDTTPSFSGTASEATPVTVEVFEGPEAVGPPVATATATPEAGDEEWSSASAQPPLHSGTFTAVATQPSAIGNDLGKSDPVTFRVDTDAPTVTMQPPPAVSANRSPTFAGTASDSAPVTVRIYRGPAAEGEVVASALAEPRGSEWASPRATPALEWGQYTAVATQPSSIGNPTGTSAPATFSVEPIAPAVVTEAAAGVTRASAALYASVDPKASPISSCYFEYGPTAAYGRTIECGFVSEIAAFPSSGTSAIPVFARVFALTPATTYHFRIVAVGEGGVGEGADQAFTTQPPWVFPEEPKTASVSTASARPRPIPTARLEALIAAQPLRPRPAISIAALLRTDGFATRFKAPEPGTVTVDWSYVSHSAANARGARSTLVARGSEKFRAAATATLPIRLTPAGRRLLAISTHLWITSTCTFRPLAGASARRSVRFELRR